ncbi:MAG: glutamyl-tRNA reductase [Thermodesulfobacteria bacterium]|nr:glutamyl-tRNA reductase [Thermodesulfobacteriota bacterium]
MPHKEKAKDILLVGVNHKTAPVEVREKLALTQLERPVTTLFENLPSCQEIVFLSTCNRVEVIAASSNPKRAREEIFEFWMRHSGLDEDVLSKSSYYHEGIEAIRHVFRVASSLDSMVVGEPQILGQLKEAYRMALEEGCSGQLLNKLMHKAFSVAKRIRTETKIASQAVSISYAAVALAKKIFGDLSGKKAMLIGAGEMAELAAQHLKTNGVEELVVANRTLERAIDLAKALDGKAISLEELDDALVETDIVISSTGAPGIIIHKERVQKIMRPRRHRLLFFIDIAVPRDIDPGVNDIDNVYLFDIDELKEVVEENKAERQREAVKAERIIEAEVIKFRSWLNSLDIVPVIKGLQEKAESIRRRELARTFKNLKHLDDKDLKAIEKLTQSLVSKLLHDPIIFLKKCSKEEDREQLLSLITQLYSLDGLGQTVSLEEYMEAKGKGVKKLSSKKV